MHSKTKKPALFWLKLFLALAVFFAFFQAMEKKADPDLGWHLKQGEWILENRQVPREDIHSYTMPGHKWVDHEWLMEAVIFQMKKSGLWIFVSLFFALSAFIPFLVWIFRAKKPEFLFLLLLATLVFSFFIGIRIQIISFLFFFLLCELLDLVRLKKNNLITRYHRVILPLFFFLWANIHGNFFSGLLLLAIFLLAKHLFPENGKSFSITEKAKDLTFFLFCLASPLINPYGIGLYEEILKVATSQETMRYIQEWLPIYRVYPPHLFTEAFLLFYVAAIIFCHKKISPSVLACSGIFFLLSIKNIRTLPLFILTSFSVFEIFFDFLRQKMTPPMNVPQKNILITKTILFSFMLILLVCLFGNTGKISAGPQKATIFLNEKYPQAENLRLLNEYVWGGYLIENFSQAKVFIDGRMPHWKDEKNSAMRDYVEIFYESDVRKKESLFEKYALNIALLKKNQPRLIKNHPIDKLLNLLFPQLETSQFPLERFLQQAGWEKIYEDEIALIYAK